MADNFGDLDTTLHEEADVDEDVLALKLEFDKIFLNCYNTPEGKRMIDKLRERHVEVAIYQKGDSLEAVAYRQGMCDLVLNIETCIGDALNPVKTRS